MLVAPLSPSNARRLGYNRNLRTTSVDLPDDLEKSPSSASTSPCSSPGRQNLAVCSNIQYIICIIYYNNMWILLYCVFFWYTFHTEITSFVANQFVCGVVQFQSTPCWWIGLSSWHQSNCYRYIWSGLVERQMFGPCWLFSIEILFAIAGRRKTIAGDTKFTIGRKW